ncbi:MULTISPECIES: DUF3558 domain-containing protein [Amycolatopsis]|uniref:DUF3558 domain-containing protein n=1 Tax=Amycolatopsis dendrobii TaxID=2760662 RepID=A0A7W3W2V0_9PSEU|nr:MULTISPECIES: DUF3558 domain-containing protein [Amycolatopsis]MBB1157823.1 DUF3558 domain-containing protein [Amycolatopsis dendrobii]UKD54002.1 DUF3558 domain-containing protein [Amycolatopsis sp. FU40]
MTKLSYAALVGMALVLAGCSAPPAPPAESSAPPEAPPLLNVRKYEQDPCALLPQAAEVFNAVRNRETTGAVMPSCTWTDSKNSTLTIGFAGAVGGLAAIGQNRSSTGYFDPAPAIDGYPAAYTNVLDNRGQGGCQVAVGVRSDETFTSSVVLHPRSPSYDDPCAVALKAATAVVATLRSAS